MSYSSKKSGRLLGRGPGGLWLESIRPEPLTPPTFMQLQSFPNREEIRVSVHSVNYEDFGPKLETQPALFATSYNKVFLDCFPCHRSARPTLTLRG
jgi:hypothetical protein